MPETVAEDLTPRLKAASAAVEDARQSYRLKVKALKGLVVDAVEAGMAQRAIAQAAGYKSTSRITQILAEPDDD